MASSMMASLSRTSFSTAALLGPSLVDGVPEDEVAGTVLDEDDEADEAEVMDELVAAAFGMDLSDTDFKSPILMCPSLLTSMLSNTISS